MKQCILPRKLFAKSPEQTNQNFSSKVEEEEDFISQVGGRLLALALLPSALSSFSLSLSLSTMTTTTTKTRPGPVLGLRPDLNQKCGTKVHPISKLTGSRTTQVITRSFGPWPQTSMATPLTAVTAMPTVTTTTTRERQQQYCQQE